MSSPSSSRSSVSVASSSSSPWQARLLSECRKRGYSNPVYRVFSDRRGGRTAYTAAVEVNGREYTARYSYDGNYIGNAKEDAAEVALQRMGLVPVPRGTST